MVGLGCGCVIVVLLSIVVACHGCVVVLSGLCHGLIMSFLVMVMTWMCLGHGMVVLCDGCVLVWSCLVE